MQERFGPKTWAMWSARLVLPVGFILLFSVALSGGAANRVPLELVLTLLTLFPLGFGATRTLEKKSGGLRLLSGAWGLLAGLTISPLLASLHPGAPNLSPLAWALPPLAIAGLVLAILHKEK